MINYPKLYQIQKEKAKRRYPDQAWLFPSYEEWLEDRIGSAAADAAEERYNHKPTE